MPIPTDVAAARYISVVTFKRDGTRVPTAVWFAAEGDKLYFYSNAKAGKVKRARNSARCEVAPCDRAGKVLGEFHRAKISVLAPGQAARVDSLLGRRYGWQKKLVDVGSSIWGVLRRRRTVDAHLEVSFDALSVQSCWT